MFRQVTSRVALTIASAVLALLSAHSLSAQSTASNPPGLCKAGSMAFPVGQAGIYVNFPVPWPAGVSYSVVVQPTNTAGYSGTTVCTYFNVLKEIPTQFQVQHKRCDNGVPVPLVAGVTMAWIACPHQ